MRRQSLILDALALAGALMTSNARAQPSSPAAVPTPASSFPLEAPPLHLTDPPLVSISRLPLENPFGIVADVPAALPAKPPFTELIVPAQFFASMRVDRTGKVTQSRRVRDPIPSLSTDSKKSLDRWVFDPARKGGQPVETWSSVRLDLQVGVRAPKIEQITLVPVTPSTPIPAPFEWGADTTWYDNLKVTPPSDGALPVEQVDTPANPKKTRWDADSYKGPFSCRFWIRVGATGRIDKSIPIQVSDPVLIAYMRRAISSWQLRPAQVRGQAVDSWSELAMSGQIGYSVEVKQIFNLRKTITGG